MKKMFQVVDQIIWMAIVSFFAGGNIVVDWFLSINNVWFLQIFVNLII